MQGYTCTRVYKGIHVLGYTRIYVGVQGYRRVDKGVQAFTRVYRGMQEYTVIYKIVTYLTFHSTKGAL